MNESEEQRLHRQLAAAQETIKALSRRMHQLEHGDAQLPLQKQLQSYQQRIEEKTEALHEVKNWFELTVQHSMDAIIRLDQQGVIRSWNPMAEQMFGYSETEALGQLIENLIIPPRLQDEHLKQFRRHLKQGDGELMSTRIEGRALCKDGSELPVEFVSSAVRKGDTLALIMVMRDISDRKAVEQALTDSHANLEMLVARRTRELRDLATIIEVTVNFVGIADLHGKVLYINPAGRKMVGLARDAVLDTMSFADFHDSETCQRLAEDIIPKTIEQGIYEEQFDFIDRNGDSIPTACTIMSLPDEQGLPDRTAVIARDLRDEIALQRQVEHGQRLESLGVLAGGIAHDFNNILTAILGNAALAELKIDQPQETAKYLHSIVKSSERAASLCKQMLAYSGKGKFIVKPLNLSNMVEDITKLLKVSIARNVTIDIKLAEQLPAVDIDESQIQQVIMNLVINASDAIGDSDGTITIETGVMHTDHSSWRTSFMQDDMPQGHYVFLEVTDDGCGMDEKVLLHIFDPFFTTKFTGRGLGLSAVLGIIRGHQGTLKVDSKPGFGTSFRMLLPISQQAVMIDELSTDGDEKAWHSNGTILIIDDEDAILEIASIMIEEIGLKAMTAKDGIKGVETYRKYQSEIIAVLLDMTMPKMDGQECFRQLYEINNEVIVILSSGYNEQDAISNFTHKGLAGFIQKPYRIEALEQVIRAAIDS
jgi:PAS domain S-box-containing protein